MSLVTNKEKHLFTHIWVICVSFSVNSFAQLTVGLFLFINDLKEFFM